MSKFPETNEPPSVPHKQFAHAIMTNGKFFQFTLADVDVAQASFVTGTAAQILPPQE